CTDFYIVRELVTTGAVDNEVCLIPYRCDETARCGNCDGDDEAHIRNIHLSRNFKCNRKHQNCCSTVRNQFCKYICDDIDDVYDAKKPKRTCKFDIIICNEHSKI